MHAGEVYVAPPLVGRVLTEMSHPRPTSLLAELTSREREVLELVAMGLGNQEIGTRLCLAEKTIKHYMTNILGKPTCAVGSRRRSWRSGPGSRRPRQKAERSATPDLVRHAGCFGGALQRHIAGAGQ